MDEMRWSQNSVSEAPEAMTNAVRRAEDGTNAPPVPEAPPVEPHSADALLRLVRRQPLTMILAAGIAGLAVALLSRGFRAQAPGQP